MATLAIIAVTVVGGGLGALGLYKVLRRGQGEVRSQDSDPAPAEDGSSSCHGTPQDGRRTDPRVPHDEAMATSSENNVKTVSGMLQSPGSSMLVERSGTPTSAKEATATKATSTVEPERQAAGESESTGSCAGADSRSRVEGAGDTEKQQASTSGETERNCLAGQHASRALVSEGSKDTESLTSQPTAPERIPPPVAPKPKQKSPAVAPKPKGRPGPPTAAAIAHSSPFSSPSPSVPVVVFPRPAIWGGASHSQEEGGEEAPVSFEEPAKAPGLKSPSRHKGPKRRPPSRLIEERDSL